MMECCERTEADKKGGHLAKRNGDGQLVLRESAQCAKEDSQVGGGCGLLWLLCGFCVRRKS
jgi:UDP-N-acetylglucosamine pyrophosphorylase